MTFKPRLQSTIYTSLRDRLTGKIPSLTNFSETSFNWVWTQAFASELREEELEKTATYLSGLIDYAGGPITEEDLRDLGISDLATPEEINELLLDEDLDELVKILGVTRDPGNEAEVEVTFTTQSDAVDIDPGVSVGTQPDNQGEFFEYETIDSITNLDGETTATVTARAVEVGSEYNVGADTVTYLPNPPTGIQAVNNPASAVNGEDEETNDELRNRAKEAIFKSSGGGTLAGVEGFIEENVDGVSEVSIIEFYEGDAWHGSYPHAHVVVSGGTESEILDAIDSSRPVAVQHVFVDAKESRVRVDVILEGGDISTSTVVGDIKEYINGLGLNSELVDVKLVQAIMNGDSDIEDIQSLDVYIEDEGIFYDPSTDVYNLTQGVLMQDDGITNVSATIGGTGRALIEETDYIEVDDDSDSSDDSIEFSQDDVTGAVADDGGAQTTETTAANNDTTNDMTLLPSTPAVGDAYYFAAASEFQGFELNISTAGAGTWDVVWEYYNGTSWVALDNVTDNTNDFRNSGVNVVFWDVPSDWSSTSVNGVGPEFWVRARLDSFISITTQPLGQEADIGVVPDTTTGNQVTVEFEAGKFEYFIDDAMVTDGISAVSDASGDTFTEATDFEEVDVRADGIINGITFDSNNDDTADGATPDDGEEFTVTYEAGTRFDVTYLIKENEDIQFAQDTEPVAGSVTVTDAS